MKATLFHGSRDGLHGDTLRAGCCLTESVDTARTYAGEGGEVCEVTLDLPPLASERQVREALAVEGIEVGEYLYETIDAQIAVLGEHYDACVYTDMDPTGATHRCVRLLVDVPGAILARR